MRVVNSKEIMDVEEKWLMDLREEANENLKKIAHQGSLTRNIFLINNSLTACKLALKNESFDVIKMHIEELEADKLKYISELEKGL